MTTTNTYNATGALLRSTTQQGQRPYYDEAFSYSRGGMITDKFFTQDGESRHETYGYDQAARLTVSRERTWNGVWIDNMHFVYDAVGNRMQTRRSPTDVNFHVIDYAHTPGTNQLTRVSDALIVNGVTAGNPTFDDVLTYDPDGSMISRTIGFRFQVSGVRYSRIETSPCGEAAPPRRSRMALAWVYTIVGADGRQLATYNGLQGSMCGRNGVRLWPVEFNTYGPNNTRIITRADGTSEVVISDYLGSARVTLSTTAEPLQSSSYQPYGTERTSTGSGARTSYIGREHDKETDLGFYGVRLYEPEYGRFLSTDVLWGKHLSRQPFHYALNNPVMNYDFTGMDTNQVVTATPGETTKADKDKVKQTTPTSNTTTSGSTTKPGTAGSKNVEVVAGAVGTANAAQQGMMNVATAGKDATNLGAGVAGYQSALRTIGKVTGLVSVATNVNELFTKMKNGEPIQGTLAKTTVSVALVAVKLNPWVLIGVGIADLSGLTDTYVYGPLDKPTQHSSEHKK